MNILNISSVHLSFYVRNMGSDATNYNDFSDHQLLDLIKADDQVAFKEILKRYNPILINFSYRRIGDLQLAEDIVSDAWVDLWFKRKDLMLRRSLDRYLFTVVKNRILDHFRHQKVEQKYVDELKSFLLIEHNEADFLIRHRLLSKIIETEIAALPENMRIVYEMHRRKNMSRKEIAVELKMPDNSVKSNMQRALKVLRDRLGNSFSFV
jgi:RNA polymerase sigma-70 factor (family 1)